ncbi:TIGR02300 family protein [uncultured Tateyamaria sp.]|uniref:TIGR02300 family protein n=1 Tax=uncultured Tateyamaria sp. TaxID=455651 RepID=UPI002627722E|nr:TIGR02300 family protein [uncultured Tateyamaria sp.]
MPKEEWGTKRLCPTTNKRFYDMNRSPIISPYTGDVVEVDSSKTRMIAADAEDAASAKAKAKTAKDSDDQVLDEDDVEVELDDDLLDDDEEEDNVPLEELADVAAEDDDS